jgi:hypothetical protein
MTNEEIEVAYTKMVEIWGDKLPNPEHEPIRFAYYVKMFRYLKAQDDRTKIE